MFMLHEPPSPNITPDLPVQLSLFMTLSQFPFLFFLVYSRFCASTSQSHCCLSLPDSLLSAPSSTIFSNELQVYWSNVSTYLQIQITPLDHTTNIRRISNNQSRFSLWWRGARGLCQVQAYKSQMKCLSVHFVE